LSQEALVGAKIARNSSASVPPKMLAATRTLALFRKKKV
jgi:hypothetical protein